MKVKGTPKLQRNRVMPPTLGQCVIVLRSLRCLANMKGAERPTAKYTRRLNRKHGVAIIPAQPTGLLRALLARVVTVSPQ